MILRLLAIILFCLLNSSSALEGWSGRRCRGIVAKSCAHHFWTSTEAVQFSSVQFSSVIFRVAKVINIATRTTIVSNVQLDDNIRIWLLEEEGFRSAPETGKCRRRNNVFGQSIRGPETLKARLSTVDSWDIGTTRQLELAERSARRPCRSATRSSGPRYRGAVSCRTLYVSTAILYWMRSGTRSQLLCINVYSM